MTAPFYTPPVQYLGKNHVGKDYVIGDVHGRYDLVLKALNKARFNEQTDRLLCVGDLIDRGIYSELVAEFLSKDFVYAIRGNHEDMLLELYENTDHPNEDMIRLYADKVGLEWWLDVSQDKRMEIISALKQLPLVMQIDTFRGPVGLVHADVPEGMTWLEFIDAVNEGEEKIILEALWGRSRIQQSRQEGVSGIGRVYVGHTVQEKITSFGNVIALDTGAVFDEHLTMVGVDCMSRVISAVKRPKTDIQIVESERLLTPFTSSLSYV